MTRLVLVLITNSDDLSSIPGHVSDKSFIDLYIQVVEGRAIHACMNVHTKDK